MPSHIVCLTFGHDHPSGFVARGLTMPTAISRGEYDVVVNPRVIAQVASRCSYAPLSRSGKFALPTAHPSELHFNSWRGLM